MNIEITVAVRAQEVVESDGRWTSQSGLITRQPCNNKVRLQTAFNGLLQAR